MNSASQNFPHHLGVLRERMLHPTDYELAVNYFLEEFCGDADFVRASDKEQMPHLVAVLTQVVSKSLGKKVELQGVLVSYLRAHRFVHGNAQADGRIVLFFFFEEANTGLAMIIPGIRGQGDMARFHLPGGLTDPQRN
jgi:phenylpyruvate tautomerase PptA (4-oxalocrotonate tautomerase family)